MRRALTVWLFAVVATLFVSSGPAAGTHVAPVAPAAGTTPKSAASSSPQADLTISETGGNCEPMAGSQDLECHVNVVLTNAGPTAFSAPIQIDVATQGRLPDLAASPRWTCGRDTHDNGLAHCAAERVELVAGGGLAALDLTLHIDRDSVPLTPCHLRIKATLITPKGGSADTLGVIAGAGKNCVEETSLSMTSEAADASCPVLANGDFECLFMLDIINSGPGSFHDAITVSDQFSLFQSFSAAIGWKCQATPGPTLLGVTCTSAERVDLPPGRGVRLRLGFEVPASRVGPGNCKLVNTAWVQAPAEGTTENVGSSRIETTASVQIVSRRCAGARVVVPVLPTCPGDTVRLGRDCLCRDGLVRTLGNRCVWLEPIGPKPPCLNPVRRKFDGACCPEGQVAQGLTCALPPQVRALCPPPEIGYEPACLCPDGRLPVSPGHCLLTSCPPSQVLGSDSNCHCPPDRPVFAGGVCTSRQVTCVSPLVPLPGNICGCLVPGQMPVGGRCTTLAPQNAAPKPLPCPAPAAGTRPNCSCPSPLRWSGASCFQPLISQGGKAKSGP
jgi:hypothetical protein